MHKRPQMSEDRSKMCSDALIQKVLTSKRIEISKGGDGFLVYDLKYLPELNKMSKRLGIYDLRFVKELGSFGAADKNSRENNGIVIDLTEEGIFKGLKKDNICLDVDSPEKVEEEVQDEDICHGKSIVRRKLELISLHIHSTHPHYVIQELWK